MQPTVAYNLVTVASDWHASLAAVMFDHAPDASVGIRFHLSFDTKKEAKIFSTQFSEHFVYHRNRDWQCALHEDYKTVDIVYFDKETDEKVIQSYFAVRISAQQEITWQCLIANENASAFTPVTPVYSAADIATCYQAARLQLQGLFDLPGLTALTTEDMQPIGVVKTLFQRAGYQPLLFALPKIKREFSRFQNQYMEGVGVPLQVTSTTERVPTPPVSQRH